MSHKVHFAPRVTAIPFRRQPVESIARAAQGYIYIYTIGYQTNVQCRHRSHSVLGPRTAHSDVQEPVRRCQNPEWSMISFNRGIKREASAYDFRAKPWSWLMGMGGHMYARTRGDSAPCLPGGDLHNSVLHVSDRAYKTFDKIGKHTFFSSALNSFHSFVMSFAASPSGMPLKSPPSLLSIPNLK